MIGRIVKSGVVASLFLSSAVFAGEATGVRVNGVDVGVKSSGAGWDYDSAHRINIKGKNRVYTISGRDSKNFGVRIKIQETCTVHIEDLTLTKYQQDGNNALWVTAKEATLTFSGTNTLIGGAQAAGIGVRAGHKLNIEAVGKGAMLTVRGGEYGAGIGGDGVEGDGSNSGEVIIDGGTIYAYGGDGAAGIGGGAGYFNKSGNAGGGNGTVVIRQSSSGLKTRVVATGGEACTSTRGGAGIGGGSYGSDGQGGLDCFGGSVFIEGGNVTATGGDGAAGIGGAFPGGAGGHGGGMFLCAITGGEVTACTDGNAAAVGSAANAPANSAFQFLMTGGRVRACESVFEGTVDQNIGGGPKSPGGTIAIYGGTLYAKGLGGGLMSKNGGYADGEVLIRGGSVMMEASEDGRNAPLGYRGKSCFPVTIVNEAFATGKALRITGFDEDKFGVNGIFADGQGQIRFWLTRKVVPEEITINEIPYWYDDERETFVKGRRDPYSVTFDANGGTVAGKASVVDKVNAGEVAANRRPQREGYKFLGWKSKPSGYVPGETPIDGDVKFTAEWKQLLEEDKVDGQDGPPTEEIPEDRAVYVTLLTSGGTIAGKQGTEVVLRYAYGQLLGKLPEPTLYGCAFDGWYSVLFNRPVHANDVVTGDATLYAAFHSVEGAGPAPVKDVHMYTCMGEAPNGYGPVWEFGYELGKGSLYNWQSGPTRAGYRFLGWFSKPAGGSPYPAGEEVYGLDEESYYAHWEPDVAPWQTSRYSCVPLEKMIEDCPDLSDVKAVTPHNLPAGLKIVQDKAKTRWYLEGVATETLLGSDQFATVDFTCRTKGNSLPSRRLLLQVKADERAADKAVKDSLYGKTAQALFGDVLPAGVVVDSSWTVTPSPSGVISYTKGGTTWKNSGKNSVWAEPLSLYGEPKTVGPIVVTASRSVVSEVPGSTSKFTEKYFADVMVMPPDGYFEASHVLEFTVDKDMKYRCLADVAAIDMTDSKTTWSTLPAGFKFTRNYMSKGEVPAGSFYGTPTKTGTFAVTFRDRYGAEEYFLLHVQIAAMTKMVVKLGTKTAALKRQVDDGDDRALDLGAYTLMRGARVEFPVDVETGATVTQAGLPSGLLLGRDKTTGRWAITGYPTKTGVYHAKLTATRNKIPTFITLTFDVVPNEFAGEYRGYMVSHLRDHLEACISPLQVNVAEGGAVSVLLTEFGVTSKYTAPSFNWDDLNGNAWIEILTKKTSILPFVRKVRLDILDRGGWKAIGGSVEHPARLCVKDGYLEAWPVVPRQTLVDRDVLCEADWDVLFPRTWNFCEDVLGGEDGDESAVLPVSLLTVSMDYAKGTASVSGLDAAGTKYAVSALPVVRIGDDACDIDSYAYAPFAFYDKAEKVTHLYNLLSLVGDGGEVLYDMDSSIRGGDIRSANWTWPFRDDPVYFAETLAWESRMICRFADRTEVFRVIRVDEKKAFVQDLSGNVLVTTNVKVAKDGIVNLSFTDRKGEAYAVRLAFVDTDTYAGLATTTRKVDKKSVKDWAIIEIVP